MSEESFADFIDDYYAESEEHLTSARAALLELEASVDQPANQHRLVHDLFRFFHSLKGISAMVELRPAERLSHELESYLRAVRSGELAVTPDGITLLLEGTQAIEQIISAHRSKQPGPAIDAILGRIARAIPAAAPSPPVMSTGSQGSPGESKQAARWKCTFAPTRELFDRGISVDIIRRRLAEVGMVVEASPLVMPDASIAFNFTVEAAGDADLRTVLQNDPLAVERLEKQPKAAEAVASIAPAELDSETGGTTSLAPSHVVRVDLSRLDELMRHVSDLVISRARLHDSLSKIERYRARHRMANASRRTPSRSIASCARCAKASCAYAWCRSARSSAACRSSVRDLARESGKKVTLAPARPVDGNRQVPDRADDGSRSAPGAQRREPRHRSRRTSGLPPARRPEGTITLSASAAGELVTIEIADDGRGVDAAGRGGARQHAGLPRAARAARCRRRARAALFARLLDQGRHRSRQRARRRHGGRQGDRRAAVRHDRARDEPGQRHPVHDSAAADAGDRRRAHRPRRRPNLRGAARLRCAKPSTSRRPTSGTSRATRSSPTATGRCRSSGWRACSASLSSHRARFHVFVIGTGASAIGIAVDRIVGQREIVVRTIADPLVRVEGDLRRNGPRRRHEWC